MSRYFLVINSGSSSIKFRSFKETGSILHEELQGMISNLGSKDIQLKYTQQNITEQYCLPDILDHAQALSYLLDWLEKKINHGELIVGHRVVHGGKKYTQAVQMTPEILNELKNYIPMAPTHQENNLRAIELLLEKRSSLIQIACFDTAFHSQQKKPLNQYALPCSYYDQGIRKYGFHGLSYESITEYIRQEYPELYVGKMIVAHLGNGSSLCAINQGSSVDSSMGFSTLEGLMMGTRCGSIDPGILIYLLQEKGLRIDELSDLLYQQSGLKGVSALSNDIRVLMQSEKSEAREALELFVFRVIREFGALVAVLQGVDSIIFTGGIGENQPEIRQKICAGLSWLGISLDEDKNQCSKELIHQESSRIHVMVIPSNEELMIAQQCLSLITNS